MNEYLTALAFGSGSGVSAMLLAQLVTDNQRDALAMAFAVGGVVWWLGRELKDIRSGHKSLRRDLNLVMEKLGIPVSRDDTDKK